MLRVPGHSQRYIDFLELAADAAKNGMDAFHLLLHHWESRDFDVLVVRDGERFARTQALHAYITERTHERFETLDAEIAQLEDQARILIRKQITAREDLQRVYDEEIAKLGEQLRIVKDARLRLQGEALASQQTQAVQQATLKELSDLTLEKFWQQGSRYISQVLHRLMGKRRPVILHGDVIGVAEVHRKKRRRI